MDLDLKVPTEILFDKDIIKNNYKKFENLGEIALIVIGKKSAKINGALRDILSALDAYNKEYYIFDKVEENPSIETIESASNLGRTIKADFIIGIGGGSAIDASKAIAFMIKNSNVNKDNIFNQKKLDSLPVIAVPTTAGTGSEVTQYSIITDNNKRCKRNLGQDIYPKIAFIDPKYTKGLNIEISRNTAMDSFSHIVEGYLNSNSTEYTDRLALEALKIWSEASDDLLDGTLTDEDREKLMVASTIGGAIISKTGTSLPHGMGYPLTYYKNIPHGIANLCLYNEYLDSFKNKNKINNIVNILGFTSLKDLKKFISKLIEIDINVTKEEIKSYTDEVFNNKDKLKNHIENITYDDLYNIYYKSLIEK